MKVKNYSGAYQPSRRNNNTRNEIKSDSNNGEHRTPWNPDMHTCNVGYLMETSITIPIMTIHRWNVPCCNTNLIRDLFCRCFKPFWRRQEPSMWWSVTAMMPVSNRSPRADDAVSSETEVIDQPPTKVRRFTSDFTCQSMSPMIMIFRKHTQNGESELLMGDHTATIRCHQLCHIRDSQCEMQYSHIQWRE